MIRRPDTKPAASTHDEPGHGSAIEDHATATGGRLFAAGLSWPWSRSEDRSRRRRPAAKAINDLWACSCAISANTSTVGSVC